MKLLVKQDASFSVMKVTRSAAIFILKTILWVLNNIMREDVDWWIMFEILIDVSWLSLPVCRDLAADVTELCLQSGYY